MEQDIVRKVLQAKRIFVFDSSKDPKTILQDYGITKTEVHFWFYTFYKKELPLYRKTIEELYN